MGQIVDELESMGYVERRPDPQTRARKLITLTERGQAAVDAGQAAITGIEEDLVDLLGTHGADELRRLLTTILSGGDQQKQ